MKGLYFSYLALLRKVANHVALLKSTADTSKKQVNTSIYIYLKNVFIVLICLGSYFQSKLIPHPHVTDLVNHNN